MMWIRIDCIRVQVNKISKFSKHLLIFKSQQKTFNFQVTLNLLFLRFRLQTYNFLRQKDFCGLNCAFPFILSVILYLWIRIRIHGPKWIRIYITGCANIIIIFSLGDKCRHLSLNWFLFSAAGLPRLVYNFPLQISRQIPAGNFYLQIFVSNHQSTNQVF